VLQLKLLRESPRTLMDAVKIALAENDVLKRWELRKGRASSETQSVVVSLMIKSPSIKFALSTRGIARVTVISPIFWVMQGL
jgi:hypothetical protein